MAGAILLPGSARYGNINFDVHTFLVAALCIIVGLQSISLAVISRRFASRYGFIPRSETHDRLLEALTLERILLVAILLMLGGFTVLVWGVGESDADKLFCRFVPLMGFAIGFYDGIFSPDASSFFIIGFVMLGLTYASRNTKILNVTSNLAALTIFISVGDVIWPAALAMAVEQLAGGYIGARTSIFFGARLIRPLVVVVSIALALRLLFFR
ncbi:MAG: TSUP family transporter [Candidatus Devosia symbiotica]|nr:TSUP family transporter [Candidatus Devosia symbiotica]